MDELTLVTEASLSEYDRRIEGLSTRDTLCSFFLYAISVLFIAIMAVAGPAYVIENQENLPLTALDSAKIAYRFNLDNFSRFNKFLVFDAKFSRDFEDPCNMTFIKYSINARSYYGSKSVQEIHYNSQEIDLFIDPTKNQTETIRLYSIPSVNFNKINLNTLVDFLDKKPLSIHVTFFTADSGFTILSFVIRCVLFIIGIVTFLAFASMNMKLGKTSISNIFIYGILTAEMLATNPFIVLDCFIDSPIISYIDAFFSQFFFVFACYCAITHLYYKDRKNEAPSKSIIISFALPFVAAFLLMSANSFYSVIKISNDPIITKTGGWQGLFYTQFVLIILMVPAMLIVGLCSLQNSTNDQSIHIATAILFVCVVALTELKAPREHYIGSCYAMQIYATAVTAIYSLFFAYFNWPVEPISTADPEQEIAGGEDNGLDIIDNDDNDNENQKENQDGESEIKEDDPKEVKPL